MKKSIIQCVALASTLLVVFMSAGCKKETVNELTEFSIDYSMEQTIPSASVTVNSPVDFITPEFPTNTSSIFSTYGTAADRVDEIKLTTFVINAVSGNLDYLKKIKIYMQSANQSETLIASKDSIGLGLTALALDLADVDIKNHLFNDKFKFRLNVTLDGAIAQDAKLKIDESVRVKASILK